uniref:NAD(P)-binding domain-containing protein n=1 Tax=Hemiselmis andersenii TaxID=464988 RepID=A0A7S1EKN3_HEMAN
MVRGQTASHPVVGMLRLVWVLAALSSVSGFASSPGVSPLLRAGLHGAGFGTRCRIHRPHPAAGVGALRAEAGDKADGWRGPGNPNKEIKVFEPSLSDDIVADLQGKRFGAGKAFYGEAERLKNKDYEALKEEALAEALYRPERPDSVLVIGATGTFGQWITLKVMANGLNTRILARDFDKAETMFGRDGANLDIYFGDVTNPDQVDNACEDAQTVIFCAAGNLPFGPNSYSRIDTEGVTNMLEAVKRYPSIRRVVLLSSDGDFGVGALAERRKAEGLVRSACPVDYAIVRASGKTAKPGGLCGVAVTQGGGGGGKGGVTPGDVGDAIAALLLMDEVAAKADAAAAAGQSPPAVPRAAKKVTLTVANLPGTPPPKDSLGALVPVLAKLSAD